jgi:hypothetical protein
MTTYVPHDRSFLIEEDSITTVGKIRSGKWDDSLSMLVTEFIVICIIIIGHDDEYYAIFSL